MQLNSRKESAGAKPRSATNGNPVRDSLKSAASGRARNSGRRLKILLVDDHAMLRDTLQRQFQADPAFEIAATADSLPAVRQALQATAPDVVLLDIQLGAESGLDAIGAIRQKRPQARIVMLSMFDQAIYRDRAFELGADAYVTKGSSFEALRSLLLENKASGSESGHGCIWVRTLQAPSRLTLTERELQVVHQLATGRREKEVAEELGVSVSSVGTYLKRSMVKMGVGTRAELFRLAGALGMQSAARGAGPEESGSTWK